MSYFDIGAQQERNQLDVYARDPATPEDFRAGFWRGTFEAPFHGAMSAWDQGALTLGETATPALRPIARTLDEHFGMSAEQYLDDELGKTRRAVIDSKPDPYAVGAAGRFVHDLFRVGSEAGLGFAMGGLPGAALTAGSWEGFGSYRRNVDEGIDPTTAAKVAGIEGGVAGVGVALPIVGSTLLRSLALGTGGNVVLGGVQRWATSEVLDRGGYHDLAKMHRAWDRDAILADALLGLAFGAGGYGLARLGARGPAALDAALTVSDRQHAQDVAPGIPVNDAAIAGHERAMAEATDALLNERPGDVGKALDGAEFLRDPVADARVAEAEAAVLRELGFLNESAPKRDKTRVQPEVDSISTAIAKLGGLDLAQVRGEWGPIVVDDRVRLNQIAWAEGGPFGQHVLRKGGRTIDDMTSVLAEHGYLPVDEHGKPDTGALFDALQAELSGQRHYAPQGMEAQRARANQERAVEYAQADLEAAIAARDARKQSVLVLNERGQAVPAHEAYAEVKAMRRGLDEERRMVEAAATCEAAYL